MSAYPSDVPLILWEPKAFKLVGRIGSIRIYGGSVYQRDPCLKLALLIDLSGEHNGNQPAIVTCNKQAREVFPESLFEEGPPVISINWRDGTAGSLSLNWWKTLIAAIRKLPPGSAIGVCCAGGTGRTGTALAILFALGNNFKRVDPVKWLRARYYNDAVETDQQLNYIEDITGLRVKVWSSSPPVWEARIDPPGRQGTTLTLPASQATGSSTQQPPGSAVQE